MAYPLCTIATVPRQPEHCIEYAKLLAWEDENPFSQAVDGDNPNHIMWIMNRAIARAEEFNIPTQEKGSKFFYVSVTRQNLS